MDDRPLSLGTARRASVAPANSKRRWRERRLVATCCGLLGLTLLSSSGCGMSNNHPVASPSPTRTALTIRVDNGHGRVSTWKLLCDPPGGDHPGPAAACEALARHGAAALPPVPSNQMCTQIYA